MYDTSKAAGFYSDAEGDEELDGYTDFLNCMEEANTLAEDEETPEGDAEAAEAACYDSSYRSTAMASFFF